MWAVQQEHEDGDDVAHKTCVFPLLASELRAPRAVAAEAISPSPGERPRGQLKQIRACGSGEVHVDVEVEHGLPGGSAARVDQVNSIDGQCFTGPPKRLAAAAAAPSTPTHDLRVPARDRRRRVRAWPGW